MFVKMQEASANHGIRSAQAAFEPRVSAQSDGTAAFELATRAHFASTRALLAAGKDKEAAQVRINTAFLCAGAQNK